MVLVADASITAVAKGVPAEAVAVLVVPVPVIVTVPVTNGIDVYTCLVNLLLPTALSTPIQLEKSQIPESITVLFSGPLINAENKMVSEEAVPVAVCSAVTIGTEANVATDTLL